ncbi:helix-turn-helix domain-containing protein [Burkholderia pseudomallei]|nr:helix-turn-helix domain-containing protein [Burkholderia pseudomallei]
MTKEHIERAITIATSQSALAKAVGVTQQTVSNWLITGVIRPEHCSEIERFTEGAVSRRQLRPNDWSRIWPELANQLSPKSEAGEPA